MRWKALVPRPARRVLRAGWHRLRGTAQVLGGAAFPLAHGIEYLWCDLHGVYVRGWVHAYGRPITRIRLRSGGAEAALDRLDPRPDIGALFPDVAGAGESGFSLYLACDPFRPVTLAVVTAAGTVALGVAVPAHVRAQDAETAALTSPIERFVTETKQAGGTVVEIGGREVSPMYESWRGRFAPECRYLASDIHAAAGVDVVCDAHRLSHHLAPGSVAGVFSLSVLEHLLAPWMVAAEINRVLRPGGLTAHLAPQTWPVHEQPNDFWRFTDEALKTLFGPATGFEVLEAGMLMPMRMLPPPAMRFGAYRDMPLHPGMGGAFILARKVAEVAEGTIAWPMAAGAMETRARAYPAHGAG